MELYDPQTIRWIMHNFGFHFSKKLGQHFITDGSVIDDMVTGAGVTEDDFVIEIGPGFGVLTRALCQAAGKVLALEVDKSLFPVLAFTLGEYNNVKVIEKDILKADLAELLAEYNPEGRPVKILGNLPYYITTPIIMKLLENRGGFESMTCMMQKEVADRIAAEPGSRTYGAISVAAQYHSVITPIVQVSKDQFMPPPKVDSAVLRFDIREEPAVHPMDEKLYFRCVSAGFSQRRKTLLNSLTGIGRPKEQIRLVLEEAGIDPKRRAETLSLEDFRKIADGFARANPETEE